VTLIAENSISLAAKITIVKTALWSLKIFKWPLMPISNPAIYAGN
jgi:hypothetical protein